MTRLVAKALNAISIGHHPAYIRAGQQTGARTFSMSDDAWSAMSPQEQWSPQPEVPGRAMQGGSEIRLATPIDQVCPESFYEGELQYLLKHDYVALRSEAW